jgi:hypothetical protein
MSSPQNRRSYRNRGSWRFADMFETVDGKRLITGKAKLPHPELPFIFVTGRSMVILLL